MGTQPPEPRRPLRITMMRRLLAGSRYLIAVASLGAFLAAATLLIFATLSVVRIIWDTITDLDPGHGAVKTLSVDMIELADAFLLGTVLYIVALGLYELFIDDELPMPRWLLINDLDDLKEKLLGVVAVLLAVTFLGEVVSWDERGGGGGRDILYLGLGIGGVIVALAIFLHVAALAHRPGESRHDGE